MKPVITKMITENMMNKINLKMTHRLLYRTYIVKGLTSLTIGVLALLLPEHMLGSPIYQSLLNVVSPLVVDVLWIIAGIAIVFGTLSHHYRVSRMGMAGLVALFATSAASMLVAQILKLTPFIHLHAVLIHSSLAISSFIILLEPPINPQTAIKNKKET